MTKEKLIDLLSQKSRYATDDFCDFTIHYLYQFFESNVCIPKGENRYPYADVLHKWLEGVEIQRSLDGGVIWVSISFDMHYCDMYRIKPSKPIYEWQWETQIGKVKTTFDYMTDEEALAFEHETSFYGINRKQETQRERK